ncbi:FadR/GntR family transcriptional regulator [Nocardia sp. NBC_01329]|uniref:FadR/GntR family transcriptional regulator n=1 Tax=Nocardia sp. NBC_01329 TaxID=2903594 RepID=UPI002E121422|nr:GntR family transcriptional regulator [Nocardia sp. NBC_01329]
MALKRIARRSVPDEIFDQLVDDVLTGELAPGSTLPAERQLAEALGVSRPTVREAVQRLARAGLVEIRQGGSTTVRDPRRSGGLELLPRLILRGGRLDHSVVRSILETRASLGREVAGLAARRDGPDARAELVTAVDTLAAAQDPLARQHAALAFWDHLVDAADSIVYRLLFNQLRTVYEPAMAALTAVMDTEVGQSDRYRALAEAVTAGDADSARATAESLLSLATAEFDTFLHRLEQTTP